MQKGDPNLSAAALLAPSVADAAPPSPTFLDPAALIESSRPRPVRLGGLPLMVMGALAIVVFASSSESPIGRAISVVAPILFICFPLVLLFVSRHGAARMAGESQAVAALDELVQLRRWPEAADLATRLLAQPMVSPERRMHALTGLATILTRYHRFEEARVVHDYLLSRADAADEPNARPGMADPTPDASTAHAIRVARAMGLLREDRLVDADRAMSVLRREVSQARDEVRRTAGNEAAASVRSAGLVLLDLYRDVKTRHFEEAIAGFDASLSTLRDQLGGRVADAWILYAAALDGVGRSEDAQAAYANATALIPAVELHRRYPETASLSATYTAWRWPGMA